MSGWLQAGPWGNTAPGTSWALRVTPKILWLWTTMKHHVHWKLKLIWTLQPCSALYICVWDSTKRVCSLLNVYTHYCLKVEPTAKPDQYKLLVQIEAVALQKSFLAVQALACLAEVGHRFVHCSRKQFQPVMCMEAITAFTKYVLSRRNDKEFPRIICLLWTSQSCHPWVLRNRC